MMYIKHIQDLTETKYIYIGCPQHKHLAVRPLIITCVVQLVNYS